MLDAAVHRLLAAPLDGAAATLQRAGIGPNTVTLIGFVFGLLAAASVGAGAPLLALFFLTLNRATDLLDGALARRSGATALGAFLDISLSYIVYGILAFAFVLSRQQFGLAGTFLILGLLADGVTAVGVRALEVPALPTRGSFPRLLIITEQTETYLFFLILLLEPVTFGILPYLYGVLCFITAGARLAAATAFMDPAAKP